MKLTWCPNCKQSFFDPGKAGKSYVCLDGTLHPKSFVPAIKKLGPKVFQPIDKDAA